MKGFVLMCGVQLAALLCSAQFFTDSNLPIVVIHTEVNPDDGSPFSIPDEPRVFGTMAIIQRPDGERNFLADEQNSAYLNYYGRISIEVRGSTSQDLPKKPFGLTTLENDQLTPRNVSLLNLPSENDWILNALAFEPSLLRDVLSYTLAREMGNYASRGKYCEVVINGQYQGLYVLQEKLKADKNRIDIVKLSPEDNTPPMVTGGYITKADKETGGDPIAWGMPSYSGWTGFIHNTPEPDEITEIQHAYIENQFLQLAETAGEQNTSIDGGYPSLIDIPSFCDFILLNELTANVDAYQISTYFHKDRNGKLRAGPVWDFNLTFGNDLFHWGYDRSKTDVWQFDNGDNTGPMFWKDLFDEPVFHCYLAKRWEELSAEGNVFDEERIWNKIDSISGLISEAIVRENTLWNTIGDHGAHVSAMKEWIRLRLEWISDQLELSESCEFPVAPKLVISRIHYHPDGSPATSDALEFIEITNTESEPVDLSGLYLRQPGLCYSFPSGSSIQPYQNIFLSADTMEFRLFYGIEAFDQYTRYLSNQSFHLILSDAFGNTIDEVHYRDEFPWPEEADGHGPFLELIDLESDNSLASNWRSSEAVLSVNEMQRDETVFIYPNPVHSTLTIRGKGVIQSIAIKDISGKMVSPPTQVSSTHLSMDLSLMPSGVYIIQITMESGSTEVKRIMKL